MSPTHHPREARPPAPRSPAVAVQKCSGECGRTLPLSAFDAAKARKSGCRSECKQCRRKRRGPRGKEGQQALLLAQRLGDLLASHEYTAPSVANVLSRAVTELRQIGATGRAFDEQVRAVREVIEEGMCRTVKEIVEEASLSRWVVDRALKKLVADGIIEPREGFAEEPGRPPAEYYPAGISRTDDIEERLRSAALYRS